MKRLAFEAAGWILVVAGIAALVLPGPGLLMVFGGLALLSQQYDWAERRLDPVRLRALRAAAESVETWPRIALSLSGVVAMSAISTLWMIGPEAPDWWPLPDGWWLFGGFWTGATLMLSALIALALVGYSFKRFRNNDEARAELDREIREASEGRD